MSQAPPEAAPVHRNPFEIISNFPTREACANAPSLQTYPARPVRGDAQSENVFMSIARNSESLATKA